MSAIYKNGIAYGGAASAANLISATDAEGAATNVQAQLDTINENITSLNDDLTNNYVTETKLKLQLESDRTVGFVTSDKGTFAITEAVHYGRMVIFPIGFTANTNISAYTTFGTITGLRYYPIADLNLYLVGNLSGTPTGMTLQVLKDGTFRCSRAISSGQTLYCTAFWIAKWEDY